MKIMRAIFAMLAVAGLSAADSATFSAVGIGQTPTVGPAILTINSNNYASIGLGSDGSTPWYITRESTDSSFNIWSGAYGSSLNRLKISSAGKVAVAGDAVVAGNFEAGTVTAGIPACVVGSSAVLGAFNTPESLILRNTSATPGNSTAISNRDAAGRPNVILGFNNFDHNGGSGTGTFALGTRIAGNFSERLIVDQTGAIVVGQDPLGSGILRVGGGADIKGTVRAKEVFVTVNGWMDGVFDSAYKLMPLREVARHIAEFRHLPEVPPGAEIVRDGLSVGGMQAIHMQKIEELTLYAIEADMRVEALERENQVLRDRLQRIEKKLFEK